MYFQITEKLSRVDELTSAGVDRKQKSITRLFPAFNDRVKKIADKGGIRLSDVDEKGVWHFLIHSGTKDDLWYDAYLQFRNLRTLVYEFSKDRRLWNKEKTHVDLRKLAQKIMDEADIKMGCSCFTGDTKVSLLDGRDLTMEQILSEFGLDKEFWIFASDENGDFAPAKARSLGVTGIVKNLVEVTLDNGETIKCTPEHFFRLRDGSYKEAQHLSENESLMPLYKRINSPSEKFSQSYIWVRYNSKKDRKERFIWKTIHRTVAETVLKDGFELKMKDLIETGIEKFLTVHHKDAQNTFDNTPENLEWLGVLEHWYKHATECKENVKGAMGKACQDPEFYKKMCENNKKAGRACYDQHPELFAKGRYAMSKFMKSEAGKEWTRTFLCGKWEENRDKIIKAITGLVRSEEVRQKLVDAWTDERRANQSEKAKSKKKCFGKDNVMSNEKNRVMVHVGKVMSICFDVYYKNLPLTEFNYEQIRAERKTGSGFKKVFGDIGTVNEIFKLALKKSLYGKYKGFYTEDKEFVIEVASDHLFKTEERICPICEMVFCVHPESKQKLCSKKCKELNWSNSNNHKVVSVKTVICDPTFVYDLTVEKYHNFALSAGVFVHNCPADLYWGHKYTRSKKQYDANYGPKEKRPPRIRNPKEYGAHCKHLQVLQNVYPFYINTMSKYIKETYAKQVAKGEKDATATFGAVQTAAKALKNKEYRTSNKARTKILKRAGAEQPASQAGPGVEQPEEKGKPSPELGKSIAGLPEPNANAPKKIDQDKAKEEEKKKVYNTARTRFKKHRKKEEEETKNESLLLTKGICSCLI